MYKTDKRFTPQAVASLKKYIHDAGGNEVFFVGRLNDERLVESVQVFARGNEYSAPALLQVAKQGEVVIHNHPSGSLRPSHADTQVASILGNDGIGFYIVNNDASDVYVSVEPFEEKETIRINPEKLIEVIGENGPISHKLEQYEYRPQQIEMIQAVALAINEDKIAIVEAGTGTGKTLAYLLPAITYAVNNKERCVISTNTINLQEQLINKDIPFLQSVFKTDFKAALVKGRTNYACKRKLSEAEQDITLFSEEGDTKELRAIVDWAKNSKDGSKSDLNFIPKPEIWEKIQSESDTSLKTKCPFYDECFFYKARRAAAAADILVANHHLLFSDLAVRAARGASENAVLPAYHRIVFDEAHNIEEVATHYFGARITYLGILRILNKLHRVKNNQPKGLLPFLLNRLTRIARGLPSDVYAKVRKTLEEEAITDVEDLRFHVTETMEEIFETVRRMKPSEFGEIKLRLTPGITKSPQWQERVTGPAHTFLKRLRRFTAKITTLLRNLEPIAYRISPIRGSLFIDLQAQLERLDVSANTLEHVLLESDLDNIRWLEVKEGYKSTKIVRLCSSPLEVAPILKQSVFKNFGNVVLTSATLTVEDRFDYIKNRLGLDLIASENILALSLPAPFDYETQALVAIPTDIPDPRERSFTERLPNLILRAVEISGGSTFVLFTSYGLLNLMHDRLKDSIEQLGINVYRQGQENRHRLLERFKEDMTSVLFATDSFWEGVDVHGDALKSVIIVKLPFRVPSEPVIEARIEAIERRGGNAFLEYAVPQAAIKFRQGFGRLIRRKSDKGSILIFDKRVVEKSYGRIFLNSLPACRITSGLTADVFEELQRFFADTESVPDVLEF